MKKLVRKSLGLTEMKKLKGGGGLPSPFGIITPPPPVETRGGDGGGGRSSNGGN